MSSTAAQHTYTVVQYCPAASVQFIFVARAPTRRDVTTIIIPLYYYNAIEYFRNDILNLVFKIIRKLPCHFFLHKLNFTYKYQKSKVTTF